MRKKQQYMTAPGIVEAPEHKNHTLAILGGTALLIVAVAACMCNQAMTAHLDTGTSNLLAIVLLTTPAWGGLILMLVKISLAHDRPSGQELLREAQYHIESEEHKRKIQASKV